MDNTHYPKAASIISGLMIPHPVTGEPCLTDAGLFATAGSLAFSDDTEEEQRLHLTGLITRVLTVARDCGLDEKMEQVILWAFGSGIIPGDGSEEGAALAKLCALVASVTGKGRICQLMTDDHLH